MASSTPLPVTLLKSQLSRSGGLEKYTWRLAKAFKEQGHAVTLLTTDFIQNQAQDPGLQILSIPSKRKMSVLKIQEFDRYCKKTLSRMSGSIVFGMDRNRFQTHLRAGNGVHAAYLKRRSNEEGLLKKFSFAINPLHRLLLNIEKESFEHPDLRTLFTNSHMVKDEILTFYKVDPQKIQVIHNGVEWHEMAIDFEAWRSSREKVARDLKLDPHVFHFLFIGHNYKRKGLENLLQALALLPSEQFHLSIVGKEKDIAAFQKLSHTLHLEKKVSFFGQRSDIRSFYQLADCLVIPSFYDPFANVTIEALAMGVFVISSKTNGGHEILTDHSGAVIERLDDPESFAASLLKALKYPKTWESSQTIRQSVAHLDFSSQLGQLMRKCL